MDSSLNSKVFALRGREPTSQVYPAESRLPPRGGQHFKVGYGGNAIQYQRTHLA